MKIRIFSLFLLFFIGILASCTTAPTPEYVPEGAERDAIVADSDVFIRNIIDGIKDNDYPTFSKDFDDVMLSSIKSGDFDKLSATYSSLGAPSSIELMNVQVAGEYFAVRYKVTYPEKTLVMRVVVNNSDPRKVSGLWFD